MSGVFTADDIDQMNYDGEELNLENVDEDIVMDGEQQNQQEESEEDKADPLIPPIPTLTRADKTLNELLDLLDDPDFTPIIPDAVTDYYLSKSGLALAPNNEESIKIKRLLALATQKFISDIATDAYEYSRIRSNSAVYASNNIQVRSRALLMATMAKARGTANNGGADVAGDDGDSGDTANNLGNNLNPNGASQNKEKVTLTMDDLSSALDEYGLNINRPQFYR